MNKDIKYKILVGLFVSLGMVLFIIGIYLVGSKKNMFSSTFLLHAVFSDVNGLESGNNVRFRGMDVGTVKNIEIRNDSLVIVSLLIENKIKPFIKKNAFVSIGTDGLMGNKLAIIRNGHTLSGSVLAGDTLLAVNPLVSEDIMRSLSKSAEDASLMINNLKAITGKLNSSSGLWALLKDTTLDQNLRQALVSIKLTGSRSATIMGDLSQITQHINEGKGSIGALITDTSLASAVKQSVVNIHVLSDKIAVVSGDLSHISGKINSGEGTIGTLLMDTSFAHSLNKSMLNIQDGSKNLNEDLEALKHSFLLRHYFKTQHKKDTKK